MDLFERIEHYGRTIPDRIAHASGKRSLSYGELILRSDRLAAHLARTLPDDTSPVAVVGHKEPEMLIAFLGAVKAGHPYVPIDIATPSQRRERILEMAHAPLCLTPEQVTTLTNKAPDPTAEPPRLVGGDDPFYIIFTSGSTGDPKGVVITLSCLVSFLSWMLSEQHFAQANETFLNQAPFSFDLSVMDLYCSLATGGTLFSLSQEEIGNPAALYLALARSEATVWVSTPSFALLCLAEPTFAAAMLPRLRRFLFCGETLPPEVAAALLDRFPSAEVWNTYGPTEATVATTSVRIDREVLARYHPLPVGHPKLDSRVVVLDDRGHPAAAGEQGEIVIAGANVSPGYLGRPDLNARAFFVMDGLRAYRTGDIGHYQDEMLFWQGRQDDQIKLHGHRIEPGDIEANLRALPGVRDAVVLPKMKDGRADWLAAFVILSEPVGGSTFKVASALRSRLVERLPAYMLPRKFYFLDEFPLTSNGKADRKKLVAMIS